MATMTTTETGPDALLLAAAAAAEAAIAANMARDEAIRAAARGGLTVRQIAARVPKEGGGTISASRVHQIIQAGA
jgi:hypothetical protein